VFTSFAIKYKRDKKFQPILAFQYIPALLYFAYSEEINTNNYTYFCYWNSFI